MKAGIVGFRGSGKTTVFNALTGLHAEVGGFSAAEAKNLGTIKVPDERLAQIADKVQPKKLTYAEITFTDLAAASPAGGKGFPPAMLNDMKALEALVHVVRGFDNPAVPEPVDILRDARNFESELALSDLMIAENRLARLAKQGAKTREREHMEAIKSHLDQEKPLRTMDLSEEAWAELAGFGFLSLKPCLLLVNVAEDKAAAPLPAELGTFAAAQRLRVMAISGQVEMEVNDLETAERSEYLKSLGLDRPAKDRFIREAYDMLNLISFFTFGPEEVRAWTIHKGTKAHQAAGKIHSDIERGFIRAEVMDWRDVVVLGAESKMREAKKIRLEGKEYIPQDGDVIHFRFNV
ncbi:MAG: redox-regulated ATPase YchF [Myxococcales bacterium]|nr:MAG: redox-regulated ATPase YchF [Myxococcales bacterium]